MTGLDPSSEPPGFTPQTNLDIFSKFLFNLVGVVGGALGIIGGLAAPFVRAAGQEGNLEHPNVPFDPVTAATGYLRSAGAGGDWAGEAKLSGMSGERFLLLQDIVANYPTPDVLFQMANRGFITSEELNIALTKNVIPEAYLAAFQSLQYSILSPADYVTADVQNAPQDTGVGLGSAYWQEKAAAAGLSVEEYGTAYWIAGNPPGPGETLQMMNRGIITEAVASQALAESRLKDKYIPQFLQLAQHLIPMRTINTLLTHGIIDQPTAEAYLQKLGFSATDAGYLSKGATGLTAAANKQLNASKVLQGYEDQLIPAATAITMLGDLGYSAATAQEILTLADDQAQLKYVNSAVTKISSLYVSRRITSATAQADLSAFGITPAQQTKLLALWALEQEANVSVIPLTDLINLLKAGLIAPADFIATLEGQGYSTADATLLAKFAPAAPPPATV